MKPIRKREKMEAAKPQSQPGRPGRQMKNAFLQARTYKSAVSRTAGEPEHIEDSQQENSSEYAEERVQGAANILTHDTARMAAAGTEYAARQGRKLFQHRQEVKAGENRRQNPADGKPSHVSSPQTGTVREEGKPPLPNVRVSGYAHHDIVPKERPLPQRVMTAKGRRIPYQRDEAPRIGTEKPSAVQTSDSQMEERGRALAKNQAVKRGTVNRQKEDWGECPSPSNPPGESRRDMANPLRVNQTERAAYEEKRLFTFGFHSQTRFNNSMNVESPGFKERATMKKAPLARPFAGRQRTRENRWRIERPTVIRPRSFAIQTPHRQTRVKQAPAQNMKRVSHVMTRPTAKIAAGVSKTVAAAGRSLLAGLAGGSGVLVAVVLLCLIGLIAGSGWGVFFSGEDGGTGWTMPGVIWEIQQEYEERLEEIRAATPHDKLQISGSRAGWPDVLAVYAVRTTTGSANLQEVATIDDGKEALLREIFWAMNPIEVHTEIRNISEGETETTLYIRTASKTAQDMADEYTFDLEQQAQLSELLAPENRSLWNALLYGIDSGEDMVAVALSQIGNVGGQPYWSWYGYDAHVEWCACFVSWCANECGYLDSGVLPRFSNCAAGVRWFQNEGRWQERSHMPNPGDIIFFDWDGDGLADHVGIVEKAEDGIIYTIEGNSNDRCKENRYRAGSGVILGYGVG